MSSKCRLGINNGCWRLYANSRIGWLPWLCEACYQEYKKKESE